MFLGCLNTPCTLIQSTLVQLETRVFSNCALIMFNKHEPCGVAVNMVPHQAVNSSLYFSEEEASALAGNALTADRKVQVQWSSRSEIQQALTNLGYLSPSVTPVAPLNQSLSALSLR